MWSQHPCRSIYEAKFGLDYGYRTAEKCKKDDYHKFYNDKQVAYILNGLSRRAVSLIQRKQNIT